MFGFIVGSFLRFYTDNFLKISHTKLGDLCVSFCVTFF